MEKSGFVFSGEPHEMRISRVFPKRENPVFSTSSKVKALDLLTCA